VKRFFVKYDRNKDGYIGVAEGALMLGQERCNGHTMLLLLRLNISAVAKALAAHDQEEFRREFQKLSAVKPIMMVNSDD